MDALERMPVVRAASRRKSQRIAVQNLAYDQLGQTSDQKSDDGEPTSPQQRQRAGNDHRHDDEGEILRTYGKRETARESGREDARHRELAPQRQRNRYHYRAR